MSNTDKVKHGNNAKDALEALLKPLEKHYLKQIVRNYCIGENGYENKKQFKADYLLIFKDNTNWIVHSTTSYRSDRAKGNQWDFLNIKKNNKNVSKAILVYPDSISEKEKNNILTAKKELKTKKNYTVIDDIFSQWELFIKIEEYALKDKVSGAKNTTKGNVYEEVIATILSNKSNLNKIKYNSNTEDGLHYKVFKTIINAIWKEDVSNVKEIKATNDKHKIGYLSNGGNPKTDILTTFMLDDGSAKHITISSKRTSNNMVSGHEFSADAISDVLNKDDDELRELLNEFQKCSNVKNMNPTHVTHLKSLLNKYNRRLVYWVIGGYYSPFLVNEEKQCAQYILLFDNNENGDVHIHSTSDYCEYLLNKERPKTFGTPLSWTFQSKSKGKKIQLKIPAIKEI